MNKIDDYMTPAEAAFRWGIPQETVKSRLKPSLYKKQIEEMLKKGLIKYFQHPDGKRREWILSVEAMKKWFGEEQK
ncbi:helix-turn-helix domain-containing protein [Paenibacillus sp. M1]|uniref:Helix-turn-helix domain-containing protein n=1 Tax=Paenibacillus haidiansis TaxID=1574488 RepID=A0ABU7VMQ6_9BACL